MSELHDRVNAIKKQQAEQARAKHEESLGWPIRKPTKEEAPLIREFLQNYKQPWEKWLIWTPEHRGDHMYGSNCIQTRDKKNRRRCNIREVECVTLVAEGSEWGSTCMYILRDGRVSGWARHEYLLGYLAALLARS